MPTTPEDVERDIDSRAEPRWRNTGDYVRRPDYTKPAQDLGALPVRRPFVARGCDQQGRQEPTIPAPAETLADIGHHHDDTHGTGSVLTDIANVALMAGGFVLDLLGRPLVLAGLLAAAALIWTGHEVAVSLRWLP